MDQLIAAPCSDPVARLGVGQAMGSKGTGCDGDKTTDGGQDQNGFVLL